MLPFNKTKNSLKVVNKLQVSQKMSKQIYQSSKSLKCDEKQEHSQQTAIGQKIVKRKMNQLQNKAYFFQGQLNPLLEQNEKLRGQLTDLNRTVIAATDLLRSLLLAAGSSEARKLKLELGTIKDISDMVKEDWIMMEQDIERKTFGLDVLQKKIESNKQESEAKFLKFQTEMDYRLYQKEDYIITLKKDFNETAEKLSEVEVKRKQEVEAVHDEYRLKMERAEKLESEFQIFRHEVHSRYRGYDEKVKKLNEQIQKNLANFEDSKRNLRQIYDKLIDDKMEEQEQNFNILLKTKEEEKDRLMTLYQEKEEKLHTQMEEKQKRMKKLQSLTEDQKSELEYRSQQIGRHQKQIEELNATVQEKQRQKAFSLQSLETMKQEKAQAEKEFLRKQTEYQQIARIQKERTVKQHRELSFRIKDLSLKKQQLEEQMQQKVERLKVTEKNLVTANRKFNERVNQLQQKWDEEKNALEQHQKEIQEAVRLKEAEIVEKEKELQSTIDKNVEEKFQLQISQKMQIQHLKTKHEQEMDKFVKDQGEQLLELKKTHEKVLVEQRCALNLEMQQMTVEFDKKARNAQEQFQKVQDSLQSQIKQQESHLLEKQLELKRLDAKIMEARKELDETKMDHELTVLKMRRETEETVKALQLEKENEKKRVKYEMTKQLELLQEDMDQRVLQYEEKIQTIRQQMEEEIKLLKSSNALEELECRLKAEISTIKRYHEEELAKIQEEQKETHNALIEEQKRQIEELITQYEEDMSRLAKKLEDDIGKLNEELLEEQNLHEITKMSREEKIYYLCEKINTLRKDSEAKEVLILELKVELTQLRKDQERINEIIEEKVRARRLELEVEKEVCVKECNQKIERSNKEANMKVTQVERDRVTHSQALYEEFQALKAFHHEEVEKWVNRYRELETLFAERPSRAEDLSKIKELTEMRDKMDSQISHYQKKVDHANQIVRYLNLELQNYKDTFDIFGPYEEGSVPNQNNQNGKMIIMDNQGAPIENSIKNFVRYQKMQIKTEISENSEGHSVGSKQYPSYTQKKTNYNNNFRRVGEVETNLKETRLFPEIERSRESDTLIPIETPQQERSSTKPRKSQPDTNKHRMSHPDKTNEMMMNAENFLNMIRQNKKSAMTPSNLKDDYHQPSNERKAYRRSRPKRVVTIGANSTGDKFTTLGKRRSLKGLDSPDD